MRSLIELRLKFNKLRCVPPRGCTSLSARLLTPPCLHGLPHSQGHWHDSGGPGPARALARLVGARSLYLRHESPVLSRVCCFGIWLWKDDFILLSGGPCHISLLGLHSAYEQ